MLGAVFLCFFIAVEGVKGFSNVSVSSIFALMAD